jgi:hypothetical protein
VKDDGRPGSVRLNILYVFQFRDGDHLREQALQMNITGAPFL